jgi:hypothetical protein
MMLFVLRHAKQLLRATDADAVLSCEARESGKRPGGFRPREPWAEWFLAAASLQPKRAREILDEGWKAIGDNQGMFSGVHRLQIALARWRLVPDEGTALVVKRFYDEPPRWATFPHTHAQFLLDLGKGWQARDRQLLIALIRAKGFETLDWQSLRELVLLVNRVEKKAVIDREELRKARHPLGMGHAEWPLMKAEQKYPKETTELKKRLQSWRDALRKHFPR